MKRGRLYCMKFPEETLAKNILTTVAYFDLYNYPLTAEQLFNFLPQNSVTAGEVRKAAESLVDRNALSKQDVYFLLPTNKEEIVEKRIADERRARRMISVARFFSAVIKRFPYVRGIFLTGSLSKNVVDPSGDVDFMIVTAPGRLWICRTFLTAFRKFFLLGSKKYFCTNYYVTANGFVHQRRNLYAAVEVVTTKPVWNESAFEEFQSQNRWTREFLPNASFGPDSTLLLSPSRSVFQKFCEAILNFLPLDALDVRLMGMHREHWRREFGRTHADRFNTMFIISPDVSAGWPDDRQEPVLARFRQKLLSMGMGSD